MEIILKQDIATLGYMHDIVTVRPGYARNFLIPQKMAVVANDVNRKIVAEIVKQQAKKHEQHLEEIKAKCAELVKSAVKVGAKVGQEDKIFGSVTTLQIAAAIEAQASIQVDRKKIIILDDVKTIGTYKASVEVHRDVDPVEITFEVIAE